MYLVEPILVDDANLLSSNLAEDDYALYNVATNYVVGDKVTLLSTHKNYECVADVVGISPVTDGLKWLDLGFNNRYAMFDNTVSTISNSATGIDVTIQLSGLVGTVALQNISGDSVQIILTDAVEGIVFDETIALNVTTAEDWYSYFFGDDSTLDSVLRMNLTPYLNANLQVIISGAASCGLFIIGNQKKIGASQYGLRLNINDYSKKSKDSFGNATFIERSYSNSGDFNIIVPTSRLHSVRQLLAQYRATPVLYIASENEEVTAIFGVFKNFNLILSNAINSRCSLNIEGLI